MNRTNGGNKGNGLFVSLLAIVLVLALIFTGFGFPGFFLGLIAEKSGHSGNSYGGNAASGGDVEYVAAVGNSKAFTIEPIKGMTISAEENALDQDREFNVYELEEDDPRVEKLDEMFSEGCGYLIGACEVDAGLGDDEYFPGKYATELDLKEMGVDESMYEYVHAYRMDSEGYIDEYSTTLDGHTLKYESSQNSVAFWVIIIPILIGGSVPIYNKYKDLHASEYYMENSDSEPLSMNFKADGGEFTIIWQAEDVNRRALHDIKIIEKDTDYEVRNRIKRKDEEKYVDYRKRIAPEVLKELMKNDTYQEKVSSLSFPPSIERLKEIIREAFTYLSKEQQAKMPSYLVKFYLISQTVMGSKQGVANTGTFLGKHNYYIDINAGALSDMSKGGFRKEDQDNMLLTICHELFHLCQMEYPNEDLVVDEATAVLLERDAYDYFKTKGTIDHVSEDAFCPNSFYEDLIFGINGSPSDKTVRQDLGYTLARFLNYCRTVTKKNVSATDIRAAYNGDFIQTIMKKFELEKETFSLFFRKFCYGVRDQFCERQTTSAEKDEDSFSPIVEIEPGYEAEVTIKKTEYSATMKEFKMPDYRESALVFTMPEGCLSNGATGFYAVPVKEDDLVPTEKGYYCPDGRGSHYLLEIFDGYASEVTDSKYYVTVMGTPLTPTAVVEDETLHITLPKPTRGMQSGRLDGYMVRIKCSDGNITEIPMLTDDLAGGVHESIYDLVSEKTSNEDAGKQTFVVTVAEYITSRDGVECCGPESLEASPESNDVGNWGLEAVIYGEQSGGAWGYSLNVNDSAFSVAYKSSSISGTVPAVIAQPSDLELDMSANVIEGEGLTNVQVGMIIKDYPDTMWFTTDNPNGSVVNSGTVHGAEFYDSITHCESKYMFLQVAPYFVFVYKRLSPGESAPAAPQVTYNAHPISEAWDLYRDKM